MATNVIESRGGGSAPSSCGCENTIKIIISFSFAHGGRKRASRKKTNLDYAHIFIIILLYVYFRGAVK